MSITYRVVWVLKKFVKRKPEYVIFIRASGTTGDIIKDFELPNFLAKADDHNIISFEFFGKNRSVDSLSMQGLQKMYLQQAYQLSDEDKLPADVREQISGHMLVAKIKYGC